MNNAGDFDDDDLSTIEQLLDQDKSNNSLSNQNFQSSSINTPSVNTNPPIQYNRPVEAVIPAKKQPVKEKDPKQTGISSFFGAPNPKAAKKTDEPSKKAKSTSSKKAGTSTDGASRINEYMQKSTKKTEVINYSKMSFQMICEHFKSHETKIGKNSGYESKVGVDSNSAQTWVYLMSKSFREYQFMMVETSLFHNTLVCLPTGLGKTFIAANVILNYYRWFPDGKIFFLAPTRPLVNQQKSAVECLKSVDEADIIELTGSVSAKKRSELYISKRIFFMTPQTIENDIKNGIIDPEQIVLLIFDEAHKALGKYSYTNVVTAVDKVNTGYRIVALSATPGNNEQKVQEVLDNLNIARLETKDENDADVKPYIQSRDIQEVVIYETAAIAAIGQIFSEILMKPIKVINDMNIFPPESKLRINKPAEINRTRVLQMLEEFNTKSEEYTILIGFENRSLFYEAIGIIGSLCNAKKILHEQGVQPFLDCVEGFMENTKNKFGYTLEYKKRLIESPEFKKLTDYVREIKKTGEKHPKLKKLLEILSKYFRDKENIDRQSRVMIFTNNRSSANEICSFLQKDDMIKPSIFIGQGTTRTGKNVNEGINQKKQIEILQKFKSYELNTLIATCIGEEGLDIGEIDLIICYDSGFSPIRLVQRMGRTGRKRAGKVIILLMQGKEYYSYKNSVKRSEKLKDGLKANSVQKKSSFLKNKTNFRFYSFNPRMLPEEITPKLVFQDDFLEAKAKEEPTPEETQNSGAQEEASFSTAKEIMNENSRGFSTTTNEDFEDEDIDYDEICAILDAQTEDTEILSQKYKDTPIKVQPITIQPQLVMDTEQDNKENSNSMFESIYKDFSYKGRSSLKRKSDNTDLFSMNSKSKLKQVHISHLDEFPSENSNDKNQLSQGES